MDQLKKQLRDTDKHLGKENARELVHTEVAALKAREESIKDRVEIHASLAQGFFIQTTITGLGTPASATSPQDLSTHGKTW